MKRGGLGLLRASRFGLDFSSRRKYGERGRERGRVLALFSLSFSYLRKASVAPRTQGMNVDVGP